jgi:periplasmic protein TonB
LSLAASVALHLAIVIVSVWIAGRAVPQRNLEPEAVPLAFLSTPAEPAQASGQVQSEVQEPEVVSTPGEPSPEPPVERERPSVPPPEPAPPPPTQAESGAQAGRSPPVRHAPSRPRIQQPGPARASPVAPSPAPAPPASPSGVSSGWQSALDAWLQANKTYPQEARRRGDQGRATVRFTVYRDGRVLELQLLSGTGSTILDGAVERLLRGARLPAFPPSMDQAQVTITLQIRYALDR